MKCLMVTIIPETAPDPVWLYLSIGAAVLGALAVILILLRQSKQTSLMGTQELLGLIGEARTELKPEGMVFVRGELWKAKALQPVAKGSKVEVLKVEDMVLEVTQAEKV